MIELLDSVKRTERNHKHRGHAPGNSTLNRRTQPNSKTYVCRLGYNTAANSYTGESEIGRLSGSSLNRAEAKRRKLEREKIYYEAEAQTSKICKGTHAYDVHKNRLELLRTGTFFEPKYKRKFPCSLDRCGKPVHMLSKRSKGKVRDKCTALYRCFKENGILATLTFINDVEDKQAVKILNKFLTALRDDKGKIKYIWVAERQMKTTGRIHFHVILDRRLEVEKYNALWVLQQYNAGICHPDYSMQEIKDCIAYDETRPDGEDSQLQQRLNPFDVEKIKSMYGLSYYLTKYITKNESGGFTCLAWHCSRSVSKLFTKTVVSRSTFSKVASARNSRVSPYTGNLVQAKNIKGAFYSLFFIENKYIFLPEMAELEQINCWILDGMLPDKIPLIDDYNISKFYNN